MLTDFRCFLFVSISHVYFLFYNDILQTFLHDDKIVHFPNIQND